MIEQLTVKLLSDLSSIGLLSRIVIEVNKAVFTVSLFAFALVSLYFAV